MKIDPPPQRTPLQNKSLHLWLRLCADFLNESGYDMEAVLVAKSVAVPWSAISFKEVIWRPIQEAHTQKESSAEVTTTDYNTIYETLTRHFATHMGITLPAWPEREDEPV